MLHFLLLVALNSISYYYLLLTLLLRDLLGEKRSVQNSLKQKTASKWKVKMHVASWLSLFPFTLLESLPTG